MKPAKKAAAKKAAKKKVAPQKAATRKAAAKSAPPRKAAPRRPVSDGPSAERDQLLAVLAGQLDVSEVEVEVRALRELATSLGLGRAQGKPEVEARRPGAPAPQPAPSTSAAGALPQRLFLLLDGRGLDGHGLPIEVIDSPTIVGSGKFCTVWVNAPQIETRHLRIEQDGEGWLLADLGTAKGTLLGEERIEQRQIRHGEEYRLAGYLRMRTELR